MIQKMIQELRIIGVLFIAFSIGVFASCSGDRGGGIVIGDPELVRTTFEGEESEVAFITIPFQSDDTRGLITNASVDFNGDGLFASYEVDGEIQEEWVVQNTLLLITDTEYTVYFSVVDPNIMPGDEVNVIVAAGETDVDSPWDGTVPENAASLDSIVTIGSLDVENLVDPAPGFIGAGGVALAQEQSNAGFGTPEDEVTKGPGNDGEVFLRKGLPDVDQDANTCVGHAIANSLSWLARKCNFTDKFQQDIATSEGVDAIVVPILEAYDSVGGLFFEMGVFKGVNNNKILEGKEQFTKDLNLPIQSKLLSREQGEFTFDDIKQAMNDSCDVEVILTMLDVDTGSPLRLGHAVTLAGYAENSSGKSFIVHDPGTKTKNDTHKLNVSPIGGLTFPYSFMGNVRTALVEFILVNYMIFGHGDTETRNGSGKSIGEWW